MFVQHVSELCKVKVCLSDEVVALTCNCGSNATDLLTNGKFSDRFFPQKHPSL